MSALCSTASGMKSCQVLVYSGRVKGGLAHFSPKFAPFFFVPIITFFLFLLCK